MRALAVLLFLAACSEPQQTAAARYPDYLDQPSRGPADNIAAIGAAGMCGEGETAVSEPNADGPAVTACESPSAIAAAP